MITIKDTVPAFDLAAARKITGQLCLKPDSVIGLSTGRTTGGLHREAASIIAEEHIPMQNATFFGLDEVAGVPKEYSGACYTMLKDEIIDAIGVGEPDFLMLPTESDDFDRDCKAFTAELSRRGGIDLLILGLGENGHLGFNQPGTRFESTARLTNMHPELEARIRRELSLPQEHFLGGVTLGIKDIMRARRIVLVAKGAHKARIVRDILRGPVSTAVPGSILQLHPCCEFLLDAAAASLL